jgi:acetylornithine/succinyldiaminopimelate/putrescine aminotransferase
VVRFAPPYIVERSQIDEAVATVRRVLSEGIGKAGKE